MANSASAIAGRLTAIMRADLGKLSLQRVNCGKPWGFNMEDNKTRDSIADCVYGCFLLVCCVVSSLFVCSVCLFVRFVFNWGNR